MDIGFKTPLLDFFRKGDVARDVRLQAAQGALATRAHEQLALLAMLTGDSDPEVAAAANATIGLIPTASLAAFLARADVSAEMREFFASRGVAPAEVPTITPNGLRDRSAPHSRRMCVSARSTPTW